MRNNETVIIVAGGTGKRMKSAIPKQFLTVNNHIIFFKTIEAFYRYNNHINIILVLPRGFIKYWKELITRHNFKISHYVVEGGDTRFQSVKNGLSAVMHKDGIVAVHDAVRPFVSQETIKNVFTTALEKGNAIPCIGLKDSVRIMGNKTSQAIDRKRLKIIQTPQAFSTQQVQEAYLQDFHPLFTDDASVVENTGATIHLVEGNEENIKITTPFDLAIAGHIAQSLE